MAEHTISARSIRDRAGSRDRAAQVVVTILVIAGFFDAISGNPIDAALLVGVAALLWYHPEDRDPAQVTDPSRRYRVRIIIAGGLIAIAFAVVVGKFGRYTWPTTLGILIPGAIGLSVAWRGTRRRDPGPRLTVRQVVPWLLLGLTLAVFELVNLLLQPGLTIDSFDHPTLSVLWEATAEGIGDTLALLTWLALGAYLIDR